MSSSASRSWQLGWEGEGGVQAVADQVIMFDVPWNPVHNAQAIAR